MIQIAVRNLSTVLTDDQVSGTLQAFQKQVSRDFAPQWGADAILTFVPAGQPTPLGSWLLAVIDTADQAGALGYHDLTASGLPIGKVFAKTTMADGGLWTVTFSHELLELLADPYLNRCAIDDRRQRIYAVEVGDAVEADALGYQIDGVVVSDFVLPGWFVPGHAAGAAMPNGSLAFHSRVTRPFQLLRGGYISMLDLRGGQGWQQITARKQAHSADVGDTDALATEPGQHPTTHAQRAHIGSRRERRRVGSAHWQRSTAD